MPSYNSISYECPWNNTLYINANIKIWVMVHIYEFKHMSSEHITCRNTYCTMITPPIHTILSIYNTFSFLDKRPWFQQLLFLCAIYAFHKVYWYTKVFYKCNINSSSVILYWQIRVYHNYLHGSCLQLLTLFIK
jgi:hypothetical protein